MAINTTALSALEDLFSQALGDYLSFATTTNIADSKLVVSTTLTQYDDGDDGYFDDWWIHIQGTENPDVERKVGSTTYATETGTLYVYGANLVAEDAAVTCKLGRYKRSHKKLCLIEAIKEVYPELHLKVDDVSLITGNILPDGFQSWSDTDALNWYTLASGTLLQTSTAGQVRGSVKYAAHCTASGANDYLYLHSDSYPRLLELQNKYVDAYVWALPQTADDSTIVIKTKQADATTQTLTSTTSCPAGEFTLIKLEKQKLNDNLTEVEIRFYIATDGQYVIFCDPLLCANRRTEYKMPDDFVGGHLSRVFIQSTGSSDEPCYDLHPFSGTYSGVEVPFEVTDDGENQYVKLLSTPSNKYRMRLLGDKPLETLDDLTDTITLDSHRIPLLIAKARMIFWGREGTPVSTEDKNKYNYEYARAERDYRRLLVKRMSRQIEMVK